MNFTNTQLLAIWLSGYAVLVLIGIFFDSYRLGKGTYTTSDAAPLFWWGWSWPFTLPALLIIIAAFAPFMCAAWVGEKLGKKHAKNSKLS